MLWLKNREAQKYKIWQLTTETEGLNIRVTAHDILGVTQFGHSSKAFVKNPNDTSVLLYTIILFIPHSSLHGSAQRNCIQCVKLPSWYCQYIDSLMMH